MAKPNKFMWTGVDIKTTLGLDEIRRAALEQIADSKGRIELAADTPLVLACEIVSLKGTVKFNLRGKSKPWVSFDVQISDESGGWRAVRTHIMQALLTESSVPFAPAKMTGYDPYMAFVRGLGARISARDGSAKVTFREGAMPPGFALGTLSSRVAPPA